MPTNHMRLARDLSMAARRSSTLPRGATKRADQIQCRSSKEAGAAHGLPWTCSASFCTERPQPHNLRYRSSLPLPMIAPCL